MGIRSQLFRFGFPEFVAASRIRRFGASTGIVLMYHEVLPDEVSLPSWTIVRESDFRWQMNWLRSHFDVVAMDEAQARISGGRSGIKPFAVVTFDDGYRGNLDTVLPIMDSMGLPFMVYVATQAIMEGKLYWYDRLINLLNATDDVEVSLDVDGRRESFKIALGGDENRRWELMQSLLATLKRMTREGREDAVRRIVGGFEGIEPVLEMLNPEMLKRLAVSDCVTIGCHTHGHELLDQLETPGVRRTIQTAKKIIGQLTGVCPKHFAYPNGNYNQCVLDEVRNEGFASSVTTLPGRWTMQNQRLAIPRLGIGRFETRGQFVARMSGCL